MMIKKKALKQLILTTVIMFLITLNSGTAQINTEEIDIRVHDIVVDKVVNAFNDRNISIALCKVPDVSRYTASESGVTVEEFYRILRAINLKQMQVIDKLRGDGDMDSLIFLNWIPIVRKDESGRDGSQAYISYINHLHDSEWIILVDSPFRKSRYIHNSLMEKYEELIDQGFLNSNNFFSLYELNAGALCTYCPEDAKYLPQFIYSKELVDDLKTIIELQENPSLLSESDDSYDTYYSSMNDDLGKRVFSRLFDNPNQE